MNLADLASPAIAEMSKDIPVVIPVAALEQHGQHLPVFTDSLLLGEIVRRAAIQLERQVLFAPLMWLGNSDHHLDFAGTLSAPPRVYLDLLNGLGENFLQHGFRRLVFLNGHGGNDVPGKQAIFELRQRHRDRDDVLFLFATYWSLGARPHDADDSFAQNEMGHACEWETSMVLRLAPHLVGDFQNASPWSSALHLLLRVGHGSRANGQRPDTSDSHTWRLRGKVRRSFAFLPMMWWHSSNALFSGMARRGTAEGFDEATRGIRYSRASIFMEMDRLRTAASGVSRELHGSSGAG
jgi:creatinine amidohydrolase